MNLHIAPDNVFTSRFLDNLDELGVRSTNRLIVRTNAPKTRHVKEDVPFAALYTKKFDALVGDTLQYRRVYIHQFTPLLYRWVALNRFNELNWAIWGADLYNLPFNQHVLYEPLTLSEYIKKRFSVNDFLYELKVSVRHAPYRNEAYSKIRKVLTWMTTEYVFARDTLPSMKADHEFFFYENQLPYQYLDKVLNGIGTSWDIDVPVFILGNSSSPDLNHLDAVTWMHHRRVKANLKIPISYGDPQYAKFLRKRLAFYKGGSIDFIDQYMSIHEYLQFLNACDGLIMNNVRPQGYGNIFLMMYLGKPVFLNSKNISIPELDKQNLKWQSLNDLDGMKFERRPDNRSALKELLSHERLLATYRHLFS